MLTLASVSDPNHARYGQHLTADEVNEMVKPSSETLTLVSAWLLDHGIEPQSLNFNPAGDWISLNLPVHEANRYLGLRFLKTFADQPVTVSSTANTLSINIRMKEPGLFVRLAGRFLLISMTTSMSLNLRTRSCDH